MTLMSASGGPAGLRGVWIALQVAEHGPRIDTQLTGGTGPVTTVSLQDFQNISAGEILPRLSERNHCPLLFSTKVEILWSNQCLIGEDDGLFDPILQLTDVTRPVVPLHRFERLGCEALDRRVKLGGVLVEKELREDHDVVTALPQWRQV